MPAKTHFSKYWQPQFTSAPYPVTILTEPPWYDFTKQNGYVSLAQKLFLKVESNLDTIAELWEQFSPNKSAFDLWDVRRAFFDGYRFEPYVLTIFEKRKNKEIVHGILPLSIDDEGPPKYLWFGSNWPEDNTFFADDLELVPLLLFAVPESIRIDCIRALPEYQFLQDIPGFTRDAEKRKYFLNVSRYRTLNDFLTKLKKKKRYNIRRDNKRIQSLAPKIVINAYDHLEELFRLNILRFRQKFHNDPEERSTFENDRQKDVFRNLIKNAGRYQARVISTIINGEIASVEMGLVYNATYFALNAGAAVSRYSGIGVFSNCLVIEDALKMGCTKIDFLETHAWKESWQMDYSYQYQFTK